MSPSESTPQDRPAGQVYSTTPDIRRKWNSNLSLQTRAATEAIIKAAQLKPGLNVLDVAGGSGNPALHIATIVGSAGHITTTDLLPNVLELAEEKARQLG